MSTLQITNKRNRLLVVRSDLMTIVHHERVKNKSQGIKYFSCQARQILDKVWNIVEKIMELTSKNS